MGFVPTPPPWEDINGMLTPRKAGTTPEGLITGTSAELWQRVLDAAVAAGWRTEYRVNDNIQPLALAAELTGHSADDAVVIRLWPHPKLCILLWPIRASEIAFGVDLREIRREPGFVLYCEFVAWLGGLLGSVVTIYPEGEIEGAIMAYRPGGEFVVEPG